MAYLSITKIYNNALVLNIMHIRYTVMAELLIALVIVVSCRIYKIFQKEILSMRVVGVINHFLIPSMLIALFIWGIWLFNSNFFSRL